MPPSTPKRAQGGADRTRALVLLWLTLFVAGGWPARVRSIIARCSDIALVARTQTQTPTLASCLHPTAPGHPYTSDQTFSPSLVHRLVLQSSQDPPEERVSEAPSLGTRFIRSEPADTTNLADRGASEDR